MPVLGCGRLLHQSRFGKRTPNLKDNNCTGEVLAVQKYDVSLSLLLTNQNNYASTH